MSLFIDVTEELQKSSEKLKQCVSKSSIAEELDPVRKELVTNSYTEKIFLSTHNVPRGYHSVKVK